MTNTVRAGLLIDTDNNTANHYTNGTSGAELNIMGTGAYDVRSGAWAGTSFSTISSMVAQSSSQLDFEYRIPMNLMFPIALPTYPSSLPVFPAAGSVIHLKCWSDESSLWTISDWAPNSGTQPYAYTIKGTDKVSDGAGNFGLVNWYGVPNIISEVGNDGTATCVADFTTVQATNDRDFLYLRVKSSKSYDFAGATRVGLLIDTDGMTTTSYSSSTSGSTGKVGAELHQQSTRIYDFRTGWTSFQLDELASVFPSGSRSDVEVRIPLDAIYKLPQYKLAFPYALAGNVLHVKAYANNSGDWNIGDWAPNDTTAPGTYILK